MRAIKRELIKKYKQCICDDRKLSSLDPIALAGYYLDKYPGSPSSALIMDMTNLIIPSTTALAANELINSINIADKED